jgi:hypothetical protein
MCLDDVSNFKHFTNSLFETLEIVVDEANFIKIILVDQAY